MGRYIGQIIKRFIGGKKIHSEGEAILSCLEYMDGDLHIAHCLEFDLVAQGNTLEEAHNNLADLIKSHIQFAVEKDIEEESLFRPAPKEDWETFYSLKTEIAKNELFRQKKISTQGILNRMICAHAH